MKIDDVRIYDINGKWSFSNETLRAWKYPWYKCVPIRGIFIKTEYINRIKIICEMCYLKYFISSNFVNVFYETNLSMFFKIVFNRIDETDYYAVVFNQEFISHIHENFEDIVSFLGSSQFSYFLNNFKKLATTTNYIYSEKIFKIIDIIEENKQLTEELDRLKQINQNLSKELNYYNSRSIERRDYRNYSEGDSGNNYENNSHKRIYYDT